MKIEWLTVKEAREKFPDAVIRTGAVIGTDAVIRAGAVIGAGRKNVKNSTIINGMNKWGVTGHDSDDGLIIVIGCMNKYKGLPIKEARKEIAKKYPDKKHIYYSILRLIQKWYDGFKHEVNNMQKIL